MTVGTCFIVGACLVGNTKRASADLVLFPCLSLRSALQPVDAPLDGILQDATSQGEKLVFVSLDNPLDEYMEYVANMPWKCDPYQTADGAPTKDVRMKLAMKYGAECIPHLVLMGADRQVITKDGTQEVQMDPEGTKFPLGTQTLGRNHARTIPHLKRVWWIRPP